MGAFFEQGQPVNLVLAITAYGPETLYYRTSQRYDFVVKAPAGEEIWRWSLGQEFTEEPGGETLDKGESVKYGAVWDQKDDDGNPVASGTYFLIGESPHCDRTYGSCGTSSAPKAINITSD